MKLRTSLLITFVIPILLSVGCFDLDLSNESRPITDSLTYKALIGNYIYIPNKWQSAKLKLSSSDTLMLRIDKPTSPRRYSISGIFRIMKFNGPIMLPFKSGRWQLSTHYQGHGEFDNSLSLIGLQPDSVNLFFKLTTEYDNGKLRITGYEANEIMATIFIFKKTE
ncbi:MAG: hypothetical protein EOO88_20700 [Pedobacter sp.]|nr:MAG: hypothetical protein EOO88_20700 [Pedobacter sp.]